MKMRKKLVARVGAIAMVLAVAMFMILPDLVSAGGDAASAFQQTAEAPSIDEEQTDAASTEKPSTEAPSTEPPSTEVPSTEPSTEVPSTEAPSTEAPSTGEPSTEKPSTEVPSTEKPSTEAPSTEVPSTEAPPTEAPSTEVPPTEAPSTETPGQGNAADDNTTSGNTNNPGENWPGKNTIITKTVSPVEGYEGKLYGTEPSSISDFIVEGTTITGYTGPGGYVAIPEGITAIGDNAFFGNVTITGVSFPGSLSSIGNSAFNGCANLEGIALPGSVTSVGNSAFANCTALASAELSAAPGTVAQGLFYNCISLTSITIPEGISSIGSNAFGSCSNLSSISLPSSMASVDSSAFTSDVNLTSIAVAGGNGTYASSDGSLYTAGLKQLLICPPGKTSVALGQGMTSIASGAFSGCRYISSITVPDTADTIASNAFSDSGIRSVTIPSQVTSIGTMANWVPDVVYGYSGSVAEAWSDDNGFVFQPLDSQEPPKEPDETEEPVEPEDPKNTDKGESGTQTSTVTAATSTVSEGTTANITQNRSKDATPKTGVWDYPIYLLCIAVFMFGLACVAYGKKIEYEEKNT